MADDTRSQFEYAFDSSAVRSRIQRLSILTESAEVFDQIMLRIVERLGVLAEQLTGEYPPQRPGSWYKRTGRLGASLTSEGETVIPGEAWLTTVGSNVSYAPDVWGNPETEQDPQFAGIWVPISTAILRDVAVYEQFLLDELAQALSIYI